MTKDDGDLFARYIKVEQRQCLQPFLLDSVDLPIRLVHLGRTVVSFVLFFLSFESLEVLLAVGLVPHLRVLVLVRFVTALEVLNRQGIEVRGALLDLKDSRGRDEEGVFVRRRRLNVESFQERQVVQGLQEGFPVSRKTHESVSRYNLEGKNDREVMKLTWRI